MVQPKKLHPNTENICANKVCMFVWNHFTNDARVLREATALTEKGYQVKLIAIHDHRNKAMPYKETINGFNIVRVKRYNNLYIWLTKNTKVIKQKLKCDKGTERLTRTSLIALLTPLLLLLSPFYILYKLLKKIGVLKLINRFSIFIRMIREGLKDKIDIYHSHDLNTLPQGYICAKIFKRAKLIYDSHEVQTSRTGYVGKKYYYLEKNLLKKIDKMIMTTEMRANYTMKLYNIKKPHVVHNYPFYIEKEKIGAIDLYKIADIPRDEPILLYQGGIQEGRGIEKIIEAIPKIDRGIVVLIGAGKLKPTIKQLVKQNKLEDRVRFINKVPVEDLFKYTVNAYLGFQVLQNINYNHYSTISNKILEYVMCEIPVIASNFPEIKKIVDGENVGLTIDPHHSENIANAVNKLLQDKRLYAQMQKNCKIAKKNYHWGREKNTLYNVYEEILGGEQG